MKSQIAYLDVVGKTYYYSYWYAQISRWPIIIWQHLKTILVLKFVNKKVLTLKSHDIVQFILYLALYFVILQKNIVKYKKRINEENVYKLNCCVMITFSMCYSETSLIHAKAKRETVSNCLSTFLLENFNDLRVNWNDSKFNWNKLKYFHFKSK